MDRQRKKSPQEQQHDNKDLAHNLQWNLGRIFINMLHEDFNQDILQMFLFLQDTKNRETNGQYFLLCNLGWVAVLRHQLGQCGWSKRTVHDLQFNLLLRSFIALLV
jgi:hypothetical protein